MTNPNKLITTLVVLCAGGLVATISTAEVYRHYGLQTAAMVLIGEILLIGAVHHFVTLDSDIVSLDDLANNKVEATFHDREVQEEVKFDWEEHISDVRNIDWLD